MLWRKKIDFREIMEISKKWKCVIFGNSLTNHIGYQVLARKSCFEIFEILGIWKLWNHGHLEKVKMWHFRKFLDRSYWKSSFGEEVKFWDFWNSRNLETFPKNIFAAKKYFKNPSRQILYLHIISIKTHQKTDQISVVEEILYTSTSIFRNRHTHRHPQ